ncbi:MAG: heparan-alpha-glucosaminide N-acetyltransferase domain-containing protein [Gemmatimonadales bacterium]
MTTAIAEHRSTVTPAGVAPGRVSSIDIIRGVVMVLMAIDHVRVYSGLPPGGPTPGIFFTRWVTHFCAPVFVFLAGTSAWLYGQRRDRAATSRFLLTRGLWLVLLELTVIRVLWTFNFDFAHYMLAGVIWMLGWSMVILAALVWLPLPAILAFGAVMVAGHNLLDGSAAAINAAAETTPPSWLWRILYGGGVVQLGQGGPPLAVLFVLVPWAGVMALGYCFGPVLRWDAGRRRRFCLAAGGAAVALFLLLRGFNLYGDPRPWGSGRMPALLAFLNTTKYPGSLLFLLMTLGPMLLAVPLLEQARGRVAGIIGVFGRVPMFYYLLHIPLIHVLALGVSRLREGAVNPWLFGNHPMFIPPAPDGYTWSLGLLYLVWLIAVVLLYFPCRWYADYKQRVKVGWVSYL